MTKILIVDEAEIFFKLDRSFPLRAGSDRGFLGLETAP